MLEMLEKLILAIICAAVPVLTGYAVDFIRKAGENIATKTDNIKIQTYAKEIADAVADSVAATNQVYVDTLKNKGEFDAQAQKEAAARALDACIASISPAAADFIQEVYNDLETYLANRIEAEVRKQKMGGLVTVGALLDGETEG